MIKKLIATILVLMISFISTPIQTPQIVEAAHNPFTWNWYTYYTNHYGVLSDPVALNGSEFLELKLPYSDLICAIRGSNACNPSYINILDADTEVIETIPFTTIFPVGDYYPTYPPNDFIVHLRKYALSTFEEGDAFYFSILIGLNISTTTGYGEFLSYMDENSSYDIHPSLRTVQFMTPIKDGTSPEVYLTSYFNDIPFDPFGGVTPVDFESEYYSFQAWFYYLPSTKTYVRYRFDRAFSTTEEAIQDNTLRLYSFFYGYSHYEMYNLLENYHSYDFIFNPTDYIGDDYPGNPTKAGYEFLGWYSRSGALVLAVDPADNTKITFTSTPLLENDNIPQDDYSGCKSYTCTTDIPARINLYARYKRIVESDAFPNSVGEPNIPESFAFLLEDLGLYDPTGLMFLFVLVTVIINGLIIYYLKFDFLFILIANLILTTLFMYFNMIPLIVGIIIMAFYLLAFLMVMKGEKTTYE